jgi:uncharacterized SAM-binding protein YcdF (DUF218 family)
MFFILSKILAFLLIPSNVVLGLGFAGLVLMLTRQRRAGVRLLVACLLLLVVVGISPIGPAMVAVLENRFPPWTDSGGPVDGIVVLGGVIDLDLTIKRGSPAISGAVERLTEAVTLARRHPKARIVFSGGNPSVFAGGPPETDYAVSLFDLLGVPAERIVLESRSRNTAENAIFSKALVKPKPGERWLLITSAMHMPRAVGCFRKAAFVVEPDPVDWHSAGAVSPWRVPQRLLSGWSAIDAAAHEWVGLLAYWITGRSSELFPGPR